MFGSHSGPPSDHRCINDLCRLPFLSPRPHLLPSYGGLLAALITLAGVVSGCADVVGISAPKPSFVIPSKPQTDLRLVLDATIKDRFSVDAEGITVSTDVRGWRETLTHGFINGFGPHYHLVTGPTPLEFNLHIVVANPRFVATKMQFYGGVDAARAEVQFQAMLVDPKGVYVCDSAGTVQGKKELVYGKKDVTDNDQATDVLSSAVEAMYEKIAKECFTSSSLITPDTPKPSQEPPAPASPTPNS